MKNHDSFEISTESSPGKNGLPAHDDFDIKMVIWKITLMVIAVIGMAFGGYTVHLDKRKLFEYNYQAPLTGHEKCILALIVISIVIFLIGCILPVRIRKLKKINAATNQILNVFKKIGTAIEHIVGVWITKFGESGLVNTKARGYIGLIGSAVVLISVWMPFVSVDLWIVDIKASCWDLLSQINVLSAVVLMLLLAAVLCLYATRIQLLGFITAIGYTIAAFACISQIFDGTAVGDVFRVAGSGFYLMFIGLIFMLLSPFMWRINEKIETLFRPQGSKEIE